MKFKLYRIKVVKHIHSTCTFIVALANCIPVWHLGMCHATIWVWEMPPENFWIGNFCGAMCLYSLVYLPLISTWFFVLSYNRTYSSQKLISSNIICQSKLRRNRKIRMTVQTEWEAIIINKPWCMIHIYCIHKNTHSLIKQHTDYHACHKYHSTVYSHFRHNCNGWK